MGWMATVSTYKRFWAWPVLVLLLSTLVLAALGWREADRAQGTAEVLMADYATFITDSFLQQASESFAHETGLRYDPQHTHPNRPSPAASLRNGLTELDDALLKTAPRSKLVDYYFLYQPGIDRLDTTLPESRAAEMGNLREALRALPQSCPASTVVSFPSITHSLSGSVGDWTALVRTNSTGQPMMMAGFKVDEQVVLEDLLVPLIHNEECGCLPEMVPESLRPVRDVREVASFVIRDGLAKIRYQSQPQYPAGRAVTKALPASIPFSNWTVEVRLNPGALRPLLPYAGRSLPWPALFAVSLLAVSGGIVSIRAQRRYREVLKLREDFVANVSHELKTPLARVRLFNDLLRRDQPLGKEVRERYQGIIDRECRRLGMLVDNVLDFSRVDRGAYHFQLSCLDFRELAEEALEAFRAASARDRFELESDLGDRPLMVKGDRDALHQTINNLLDNAVKYSAAGSRIQVRLESEAGRVQLSVVDEGPGIPSQDQERIFDPFYRVESGEDQSVSGSGLGLALAKNTVDGHGGELSVESTLGQGSRFLVDLPLASPAEVPA